jgi:hypothetical protein
MLYVWGMKRAVVFVFCLIGGLGFGQVTFQKTYGVLTGEDYGNSVQQTSDGGYIIAGSTNTSTPNYSDFYLIKTDSTGITLWTKTFGGVNWDVAYSVQQTVDGGYMIAGGYHLDLGAGDIFLIKTDSAGDTLWTKIYGTTIGNVEDCRSVQQTVDGGYIIAGTSGGVIWLIKIDSAGNILWTKIYSAIDAAAGYSVQQTTDGGYIVLGKKVTLGNGNDVYLIKTDSLGNHTWSKTYGGISDDVGNSVQQTTDGGYVITGFTNSFGPGNYSNLYLIKTDTAGNIMWNRTFGATGQGGEMGNSVQQTDDGGYIITGRTDNTGGFGSSDVYLIKTDSAGDTLWTKAYGGTGIDQGWAIRQTADGGYIITGFTNSFGAGNVYLIKTDANGNSGCNQVTTATMVMAPSTIVTSFATVVAAPPPTFVTTPAILVGSSGFTTTLCITTGTLPISNFQFPISMYPNPAFSNSQITFTYPSASSAREIALNDINGKEVARYALPLWSTTQTVKLPQMAKGVYVARVVGEGVSANVKFVIQ